MTRRVRILVSSTLLALLCAAGGIWLAADRLLDGLVRHWLTEQVAVAVDAEVVIGRLAYDDGRLRLTGLSLARPGELLLEVASIDIQFTWSGLLRRRIDELVLRTPHLIWTPPADKVAAQSEPWPQVAPLQIETWRLEDGGAELHWGDRLLLIEQLAAEGGLGAQFPLVMMARFGPAPGLPLRLTGNARWQNGLALTLDEFSWNDKNLLVQPVSISPGPDPGLSAQIGLAHLDDSEVAGLLAILDEPVRWPEDLHWQLTAPAIDLRLQGGQIQASLQTAAGFLQTADRSWPWQSIALRLQGDPSRLELTGSVGLAGSTIMALTGTWAEQRLKGHWSVTVASPAELLQSIGMEMPESSLASRDLKLHGLIDCDSDAARVSEVQMAASLGELGTLSGIMHGEWRAEGATLATDSLILKASNGERLVDASVFLSGDPAESAWQGQWSLQVPDAARLASNGGVGLPAGLPNLQEVSLRGGWKLQTGRFKLDGIELAGKLNDAGYSGRLRGKLALQLGPGTDLAVVLEALMLDALDYQAEDGMTGLLGGSLMLKGRLDLAGERLGFDLSGRAAANEALLESWYGRLAGLPVIFAAKGDWLHDRQRLELAAADVDLAGLAIGHFTGVSADQGTSLRGQIKVPQMQGSFQKTLKALFGELLPGLDQVSLGGKLMFEGVARQQGEHWTLNGAIEPAGVSIAWGQEARIEELSGRLPMQLRPGAPAADEPVETASLKWARLQGGLLDSGPGQLDLKVSANRWRLQKPLALAAAGGEVSLTALQLDLANLVPQLRTSLELKDLELLQISNSLEWPAMSGLLNARLEQVRIAGDEVSTVGDASVQIFGGSFLVSKMRVEAPFSRFPTYHGDVDFTGIDLYQLTKIFDFGEMNGIADGYIHELRLFDGTPSAFRAKLETRSEGTRNISVKAIHNLNTLSQGGLSAALSQGIYQFIDFYRYKKIGILCWLQNDLLHLEGTGRPDSNQYLIYGGLLPPRIDVVVSSPTVSFKEMVRRLNRIERAGR